MSQLITKGFLSARILIKGFFGKTAIASTLNPPLSATIKNLSPRGILTIDELHATIKNLDPRGGIV